MIDLEVERRLGVLEQSALDLEKRVLAIELRLTNHAGMIEGTKVRIERMLGTLDDLLKRFEAWKQIGNEMGETVKALQERGVQHDELWAQQQRANELVDKFMEETEAMLKKALGQLH